MFGKELGRDSSVPNTGSIIATDREGPAARMAVEVLGRVLTSGKTPGINASVIAEAQLNLTDANQMLYGEGRRVA